MFIASYISAAFFQPGSLTWRPSRKPHLYRTELNNQPFVFYFTAALSGACPLSSVQRLRCFMTESQASVGASDREFADFF